MINESSGSQSGLGSAQRLSPDMAVIRGSLCTPNKQYFLVASTAANKTAAITACFSFRVPLLTLVCWSVPQPDKHLTMIFDGMAHHPLDGPVLNRYVRWAKDTDSKYKFPTHLVGALTWGHNGQRVWCYFYDLLVMGGSNNTCEILMQILEKLAADDQLPSDPDVRVLHLQADNCADNKNWVVLALCAMLVQTQVFTKVELDFLHVGHTHEVIDQVFAVIGNWMRETDKDLSTLPLLMFHIEELLKPYHCDELAGCRDFKKALGSYKVGTLSGQKKPFSFKFQVTNDGQSVDMAYQCDERLNGEWYPFPEWLDADRMRGAYLSANLSCEPLALNVYDESKLVEIKEKQVVGQPKGVTESTVVDNFLEYISKLETMRCVVDPIDRTEHSVLSDDAVAYWRNRVADMSSPEKLAVRVAQISSEIDFHSMYRDNETLNTRRMKKQQEEQLTVCQHNALLDGQRDSLFRERNRRVLTCSKTETTKRYNQSRNAKDSVQENLIRRRIDSEQRALKADAYPVVGELVLWQYPYITETPVTPDKAPLFFGVVLAVHMAGQPTPTQKSVGKSGPEGYAMVAPSTVDLGTIGGCQLLVQTYAPAAYNHTLYSDMQRMHPEAFLDSHFATIIHDPVKEVKRSTGQSARMERHWIAFEDVVASKHILGAPIAVPQKPDGYIGQAGSSFWLAADTSKNFYSKSRLASAIDHLPCAVAGITQSMCSQCSTLYRSLNGSAASDGGLLAADDC